MPEVSPEWTAELKKGSIQLCLLALLAKEEKYGFQILRELRDRSNGFFDLKEGTLYPALRRLEERGVVESRWQEPESGMPRKYYRLTDRGRTPVAEALAIWDALTAGAERALEDARLHRRAPTWNRSEARCPEWNRWCGTRFSPSSG